MDGGQRFVTSCLRGQTYCDDVWRGGGGQKRPKLRDVIYGRPHGVKSVAPPGLKRTIRKIETVPRGWGRWTNEGAKRPKIEGEARVVKGEARDNSGGGVWGGGSVNPSPENFWKFKSVTVRFGDHLAPIFSILYRKLLQCWSYHFKGTVVI